MKLAFAVALTAATIPCAALAQRQGPEEPPTSFRDTQEEAERNVSLGENSATERDARLAVKAFAECTASREAREAHRLLTMDFTSTGYRTGLRLLSRKAERFCARDTVGRGNVMRSASLLFSGAVAEALLEAGGEPLNARLVRNSGVKIASYAATDAVAQCLARSLPDQVAALFATEPGSGGEQAAVQPLLQAIPVCANAVGVAKRIQLSVPAARAVIATAAYRLVASMEADDA